MRASQPQDWNCFSMVSALALSWGVPTLLAAEAMSLFQALWSSELMPASNFCSRAISWSASAAVKPRMGLGSARALREAALKPAAARNQVNFADIRPMGDLADGEGGDGGLDDKSWGGFRSGRHPE